MVALREAADGNRTKIAEKRVHRQGLLETLEMMARQLNAVPDLQESMILEAGFQIRRQRSSGLPFLAQVAGLRVAPGNNTGELLVEFDNVPNARGYRLEWSADGGGHWTNGTFATARRAVMAGLPIRQDLWLRVYAFGSQQRKGAPSAAAKFFLV